MLPSSAKKMKNFVLSQSHGCSTIIDGTANHSHIGVNQVANLVGTQRFTMWPAMMSGISSDVFLIQNHTKSGTAHSRPSRLMSVKASQPGSMQYPRKPLLSPQ